MRRACFFAYAREVRVRPVPRLQSLRNGLEIPMKIDLHMHSLHSDGVHPPEKLVEMAAGLGLSAISLS